MSKTMNRQELIMEDCISRGLLELFRDPAGVERVRVTPAGARTAGRSDAELKILIESEAAQGRPFTAEQLAAAPLGADS